MISNHSPASRRCGGFTLVEVMIAATIAVTVIGMGLAFIVEGTRASMRATSSLNNDVSQWGISSRLQLDSKLANGATIYKTATSGDITVTGRRKAGERGTFLVLSSSVIAADSKTAKYEKISGYSYNSTNRTLYRFEYQVAEGEENNELEKIITDHLASLTFQPVSTEVDSLDPAGPFVSRDTSNTNAATAIFRLNQGRASHGTDNSILVEVSFLIRN
jgi:hypothetical protein